MIHPQKTNTSTFQQNIHTMLFCLLRCPATLLSIHTGTAEYWLSFPWQSLHPRGSHTKRDSVTSFSSRALRSDSAFCCLSSSSLALSSSSFSCSSAFSSKFSPPTMIFFSICDSFCCSAACSDLTST